MAQHDLNLANADGATFRADANNALAALVSNSSGAAEPTTTFAYMWWADTTTGILKQRNAANSAWIDLFDMATGMPLFGGADLYLKAGKKIVFEGTTDDAFETTIDPGDPTAARTLTLPNKSGTLATTDDVPAAGGQFKNKIIGGDFTTNPWQRGTTISSISADNTVSADRWKHRVIGGGAGVVDAIKTADAPTVAQAGVYATHCLHIDVTTADASIAAGEVYAVEQRVEGYNAASFGFGQAGTRYVTLSFWHKHTKTGTYCAAINNSAVNRAYVAEYTQAVADTWEKATITIPVDTSGTWVYDSGIGLRVTFAIACGSTYQTTAGAWAAGNYYATSNQVNALDSTSNNFKIALVQLEAGSVATPFETLSAQQVLSACQRYYWRTPESANYGFDAYQAAGQSFYIHCPTPVSMRTTPTLTKTGTWTVNNCGQPGVATTLDYGFILYATATALGRMSISAGAGKYIDVNAEL